MMTKSGKRYQNGMLLYQPLYLVLFVYLLYYLLRAKRRKNETIWMRYGNTILCGQ